MKLWRKKYKGILLKLEQTKEKTATGFKKITKFENNSKCFDEFVAGSKTNSDDRTGIGFCPNLKTQTKSFEPIKFVSGGKRPIESCPGFHSLKTEFDSKYQNFNIGELSCSKYESSPKAKYVFPYIRKSESGFKTVTPRNRVQPQNSSKPLFRDFPKETSTLSNFIAPTARYMVTLVIVAMLGD